MFFNSRFIQRECSKLISRTTASRNMHLFENEWTLRMKRRLHKSGVQEANRVLSSLSSLSQWSSRSTLGSISVITGKAASFRILHRCIVHTSCKLFPTDNTRSYKKLLKPSPFTSPTLYLLPRKKAKPIPSSGIKSLKPRHSHTRSSKFKSPG